jgi:hypothetical protein
MKPLSYFELLSFTQSSVTPIFTYKVGTLNQARNHKDDRCLFPIAQFEISEMSMY